MLAQFAGTWEISELSPIFKLRTTYFSITHRAFPVLSFPFSNTIQNSLPSAIVEATTTTWLLQSTLLTRIGFSLPALKIRTKGKWVILRNPRCWSSPIQKANQCSGRLRKSGSRVQYCHQIRCVSYLGNNKPPSTLNRHYSNHWRTDGK